MIQRIGALSTAAALLLLAAPAAAQQDVKGAVDHPAFTRMPGFAIRQYTQAPFDSYEFPVGERQKQTVEGRYTKIWYQAARGTTPPSPLQIVRNLEEAARRAGGTVVWENGKTQATMKMRHQGNELWAYVVAPIGGIQNYTLHIVERQAMKQEVTANADAWLGDLAATGHAAVYVTFDVDRATIRPESEPVIAEMARLLTLKPALAVFVVGHTDNTGAYEHNVQLSRARADAVVAALVGKHGIAGARLTSAGVGPVAPIASNATDDGKAKNRRVELVER